MAKPKHARIIRQRRLPAAASSVSFIAPAANNVDNIDVLTAEVLGPVLHVWRYKRGKLEEAIEAISAKGYGLTMGLHSRIGKRATAFAEHSHARNISFNRNVIGAIVGSQPFGGRGLSGTGPKAGGPHYQARFGKKYAVSDNVAAVGGNASLLSLAE